MGKATIVGIVLIFLVLILVGVYIIFVVNNTNDDIKQIKINASIRFEDQNKKPIRTGYLLYDNTTLIANGTSSQLGAVLHVLNPNSTIRLINYNLENQNYYTSILVKNITLSTLTESFKITLEQPSALNVLRNGEIRDKNIRLQLQSNNFKNAFMCVDSTAHFWSVEVQQDFNIIYKPLRYSDYDQCYNLNKSFKAEDRLVINLLPKEWGIPDENDMITIAFIDGNYMFSNNITILTLGDNFDLGGKDLILKIPYQY